MSVVTGNLWKLYFMPEQENQTKKLVDDNILLLNQLAQFVQEQASQIYSLPNEQLQSGSIGAHVRHIIDHYLSVLVDGGVVNYDQRERDAKIEINATYAGDILNALCSELSDLSKSDSVKVVISTNVEGPSSTVDSAYDRELCFLHSHTTHHMAIIRLLAIHNNIVLPCYFGKAASTQKFEKNVQF